MRHFTSFVQKHTAEGVDDTFKPQLTSLVDVMTILLVFLIKSFSVEGTLITASNDLQLPYSTSNKSPHPMCMLEITTSAVLADGEIIAKIDDFKNNDSLTIPRLYDWILIQRAKCIDQKRVAEALIQCDRGIEFNVVKRVMFTCSKAGVADFSVLVIKED